MDTVGPYRLDALVGRGTAGSVWRATRTGPVAQVVAVKRARADAGEDGAERLRREAGILADLDHPHIVRVIDVLDEGDGVAIVMSYARGGSLHDLLAERGRLAPGPVVAVLSRVADALASAHRHGVFHGDVKPANILFTTDGEPLLGDFGVAQHLTPGRAGLDGVRGLGTVEGTVGYVDPALVETGHPDPRSDVYGLAVVAYRCLTGRLPHTGDDARATLAAAETGDHPSLCDDAVAPVLAELVEQGLARNPDHRPPTAAAFAAGLRAAVDPSEVALPGVASVRAAPGGEDLLADAPEPHVADESGAHADGGSDGRPVPPGSAPRGTRVFGPRPPQPEPAGRAGRPFATRLVVLALVAAAVGAGLVLRHRLDARQAPTSVAIDGGMPQGTECVTLEPLAVPGGAEQLSADFAGDGCSVPVVWDGRVMRFRLDPADPEPRAYQFAAEGGPGQLVIGDWDCDGADTPAFYQPGNGRVAYFAEVPEREGGETVARTEATGITGGRASLASGEDSTCDSVEVAAEA